MKRQLLTALAAGLVLASCSSYDDTPLQERVGALEERISTLETKCDQMNKDIVSLRTIVDALGKDNYITDVKEADGKYTITFSNGKKIEVQGGLSIKAPQIAIEQGEDGLYYWTVDGERMVDPATGKAVTANAAVPVAGDKGADGVTPRLRVENGWWQVSYDEGKTWSNLSVVAEGSGADSIFSAVEPGEDSVTFTLSSDGSKIVVPRSGILKLEVERSSDILIGPGGTVKIPYTLTGAVAGVRVTAFGDGGFTAGVEEGEGGGTLSVTAPEVLSPNGKVLLVASREDGRAVIKILTFLSGQLTVVWDGAVVPPEGGVVSLQVTTNYNAVSVESDMAWAVPVYDSESGIVTVTVARSNDVEIRTAVISLYGDVQGIPEKVYILQASNHSPSLGDLGNWLIYEENF